MNEDVTDIPHPNPVLTCLSLWVYEEISPASSFKAIKGQTITVMTALSFMFYDPSFYFIFITPSETILQSRKTGCRDIASCAHRLVTEKDCRVR